MVMSNLQYDGYSTRDIAYIWVGDKPVDVHNETQTLPQFQLRNYTMVTKTITLTTGDYSRLSVKFIFVRNMGFYMMQIYLPSNLIVVISWVSFWLHRDASPARVALGVTTVLTMTTLMTTTNSQLPKVSYVKSMDIYLGVCFVMVFASLIEYASVSYLNKKMKMKRERKKQQEASQVQEFPMMPTTSKTPSATFTMESSTSAFYPFPSSGQSDGYSTEDIQLLWADGADNSTDVHPSVKQLPTFRLVSYWGSATTARLSTGNYSRLLCTFRFVRNIGFYWIQIYQPSLMVVIISWVAFWINRDSAPARVTLGIMTVLTMTTLMTTTNRQMPKVSYIKAVDIYLGTCYVMVFAALLEYAAVSYSNKKIQDRKRGRQTAQVASSSTGGALPSENVPSTIPSLPQRHNSTILTLGKTVPSLRDSTVGLPQWTDTRGPQHKGSILRVPAGPFRHLSLGREGDWKTHLFWNPFQKFKPELLGKKPDGSLSDQKLQLVASGIDKYSRALFPLTFTIFNAIYWIVFLKKSGKI